MDKKKTSTKTENIFSITIWDKMNIFLGIATAATTLVFIILFVLCFVAKMGTNCHGMILGMCGVFASLASAFFIAWIMRMYDVTKKTTSGAESVRADSSIFNNNIYNN